MSCRVKYSGNESDHQPFHQSGRLYGNINFSLRTLRNHVSGRDNVYCYIIATVMYRNGQFVQKGCGPNFQADIVTLCTCKHRMRTSTDADDWRGKWIAGFTSVRTYGRKSFLVYLMQVLHAFESHYDLWFSNSISPETKQAKAAHLHVFGDIYKPKYRSINKFNPKDYIEPCNNHRHAKDKDRHKDIDYKKGYSGRVAALLVGDPEYSFLWNRPMIFSDFPLHRGQKKCELNSLLQQLNTG